jgi:hypothetical protein
VSAGARASIEPSTWGNTMYGVLERPPRTGIGAGVQVLEPEGSNQALQGFLILGGCPSSRLMVTMSGSPLASNQRKEKTGPPPVALPSLRSHPRPAPAEQARSLESEARVRFGVVEVERSKSGCRTTRHQSSTYRSAGCASPLEPRPTSPPDLCTWILAPHRNSRAGGQADESRQQ